MTSATPVGQHTLWRWLSDRTRREPEAVAIEVRDQPMTYGGLWRKTLGMAKYLLGSGLGPGDRVATVTENDAVHVALFFACAMTGMVLVPLNRRLVAAELAAQLDVASPAALVASSSNADLAASAARESNATPLLATVAELADLDVSATANLWGDLRPLAARVGDGDPLLVVFTSGSTGLAKGVVLTHANCFWTNLSLDGAVPLTGGDVVLQVLPQHHVGGWNVQPLQGWWKGATIVLEPLFDPERVLALVERRRVTTMMGVPTTYQMLAAEGRFTGTDLSSLRQIVVGGAPMPPDLLEIWQRRGVAVVHGYGLTEAAPNVLCLAPGDARARPGSVGRPYGFVDVELHHPDSRQRIDGPGTGELWVSGPNVFAGYWQDPAATADTMVGAWLRTGDLAERDGEGFFRICGRLKDLYISGGENVYPAEVEAVLRQHPGVADAAVLGTHDRQWGESGVAFVQPRPSASVSGVDLIAHCRRRLAGFKVPRRVVVMDELPQLGSGKVDRRELALLATRTHEEEENEEEER